jgi:hypothetical protein
MQSGHLANLCAGVANFAVPVLPLGEEGGKLRCRVCELRTFGVFRARRFVNASTQEENMVASLQFEHRLKGYALVAGAAAAATQAATAAIVYTDVDPDEVFTLDGLNHYDLDLNNDLTPDFDLSVFVANFDIGPNTSVRYSTVQVAARTFSTASGNAFNEMLRVSSSSQTARMLNSNYLISASNSSWSNSENYGWMAWKGSSFNSGEAMSSWSGGEFLGRNRKMLGLRFRFTGGGNNWHYGWCRVSVDKYARQFIVHDYAYDDEVGRSILSGAKLEPILAGTVGSQVALTATVVPDVDPAFTENPKITGYYFDPVKGKKIAKTAIKGTLNEDGSQVILDLKKKVKLYDAKAFKAAYKAGTICDRFLGDQPNQGLLFDLDVTHKVAGVSQTDRCAQLSLLPPQIVGFGGEPPVPGNVVAVDGNWFGVKPPKVWLEYGVTGPRGDYVKQLKLKVLKPYPFANAKDKPNTSCMDVDTGESQIQVQLPDAWPKGWGDLSTQHFLVIDNGIGLATRLLIDP